jgi:hypothetical protein
MLQPWIVLISATAAFTLILALDLVDLPQISAGPFLQMRVIWRRRSLTAPIIVNPSNRKG